MTDSNKPPLTEEEFIKAAKITLDNKASSLDPQVRQRLQQARRRAVEAARKPPSTVAAGFKWPVSAGAFGAFVLVTGIAFYTVFYTVQSPQDSPSPLAGIEDMPIIAAPEELEMYEELDFYQWLTQEHGDVG